MCQWLSPVNIIESNVGDTTRTDQTTDGQGNLVNEEVSEEK